MQRHEYAGPVALRAMQSLAGRLFPDTGYRHIGDLAWAWCLALDRDSENPTAVWTDGDGDAPAAGSPTAHRPLAPSTPFPNGSTSPWASPRTRERTPTPDLRIYV
ncbi:hypothetical protein [Streptomyces nigrescens]|uniref:Uncharacterized protein n=1 Tax=Streptomyces nigrescens TaxID=1920 RepID=A0ABY7IGB4_STRNI|nr:hypothetical protein [Streptomyces libani]WAT97379.1 hypothetical protein STRLI_003309 [Streptomyces libani subsp. libani]